MSVRKKSIEYAAAALVVSVAIIAASILYMGPLVSTNQSSSSAQGGQTGTLAIRLTDPPQVPSLTSSLNLTYSSLTLLVGEPTGSGGQLNVTSVMVNGSATVDLLKLQNVSQTIALASLPNGSVLYSVTFNVTSIKIDVNNTISDVSLATGGSAFQVTIAHPAAFQTGDYALMQLNPVVVNTPSGYELIPSAVGIMGHGQGPEAVGSKHQLTNGENSDLNNARGNVSASILTLSVSQNVTTFTVLVNNSASIPVSLNAIGLHGNFTVFGNVCQSFGTVTPYQPENSNDGSHDTSQSHSDQCSIPMHMDEVVFVPLNSSAPGTGSCAAGNLSLVSGMNMESDYRGYSLGAGQCVVLSFSGNLTFGESNFVLVPSTSTGQVYVLHVIGSNGANLQVSCTLQQSGISCTSKQAAQDSQDW